MFSIKGVTKKTRQDKKRGNIFRWKLSMKMFLQHYYKDKKLIFLACIHEHGFVKTFCAESVKFPLHRFYPLSVLNKRFEREHRFNHNIESCLKPSCACSLEWNHFSWSGINSSFFLHCHHFNATRSYNP